MHTYIQHNTLFNKLHNNQHKTNKHTCMLPGRAHNLPDCRRELVLRLLPSAVPSGIKKATKRAHITRNDPNTNGGPGTSCNIQCNGNLYQHNCLQYSYAYQCTIFGQNHYYICLPQITIDLKIPFFWDATCKIPEVSKDCVPPSSGSSTPSGDWGFES